MPPAGLLCFQAATGSDLAISSPESHPSISAPAAEGGGITKAGLSTEKHASYSTSVIREDIEATVDLPPKLPTGSVLLSGRDWI
jgi:hypothetical protein